jgi:hypothetical protein
MKMANWEELNNWEYHFNLVKEDKQLPEKEKAKILDGWGKLRQIFGEDWPEKAVANRHSLFPQFFNEALWQRLWIADFGERLYELQALKNFGSLKQRLLDPNDFSSAEAEFRVASMVKRAGLPLTLIAPKGAGKKPDLMTEIENENVSIEVTTITSAAEVRQANETLEAFNEFLFVEGAVMAGRLHKILAPPRVLEIKKKIRDTIEKVKADKLSREISEPGVIDCFIAPKEKPGDLEEWQRKNNMSATWQGPEWKVVELKRVKNRIDDKVKQIPQSKPGIIVIYDNCLIFHYHAPNFMDELVYELEDTIYRYNNLLGVAVIVIQWSAREKEAYNEAEKYIICEKTDNSVGEMTLILKNKYCTLPMKEKARILWDAIGRGKPPNQGA